MEVIKDLQDLRYLKWTRTRHSSGTAGSFLKSQEIRQKKKIYYKLSNYNAVQGIVGHESVNEIVVDRLLTKLEIPHLDYQLVHALISVNGRTEETYLCRSQDFKQFSEKKVALDVFYDMESYEHETPMEFCKRFGFDESIYHMLIVDFLIVNRDRHGANIEVLKNGENRSYRIAPLFDHGVSLLFSCYNENDLSNFDFEAERKVQSFVGSNNVVDNIKLVPKKALIKLPPFDETMKNFLFQDLTEIQGERWANSVWKFMKMRAKLYEDICNTKC